MPKARRTPRKAAPQGKILRRDGRAERVCINEDTSCITGAWRRHRSSRAPVIASDRTARAGGGDPWEPSGDARAVPGSESPPAGGRRPRGAVAPAEGGASGGRKAEARAQRAATPTSPEASSGARSGLLAGKPAASGARPTTARRRRRARAASMEVGSLPDASRPWSRASPVRRKEEKAGGRTPSRRRVSATSLRARRCGASRTPCPRGRQGRAR